MMNELSERRLKENEVIFQQANKGVADMITEDDDSDPVVKFYCECSNMDCRERIPLKVSEYLDYHKNQRRFIALTGHEMPAIEKIVTKNKTFSVVQKFGKVPSIQDIDRMIPSTADGL
jgi:hypothetical protein